MYYKQGLTVIECKRGGDVFSDTHSKWLQTVGNNPEAMLFKFVPITSLLNGIPGSGYLSHAINLYLRCKSMKLNPTKSHCMIDKLGMWNVEG